MKRIATLFRRGQILLPLLLTPLLLPAQSLPVDDAVKGEGAPAPLRIPTGFFESLPSLLSNVAFHSTNYGIIGLDVVGGEPGLTWPRGSGRTYLNGGGLWFGAEKFVGHNPDDPGLRSLDKMSVIGYDPSSGTSWMVPGRVTPPYESSALDESAQGMNNHRLYRSPEYDPATGEPLDPADRANDGARWPLWLAVPGVPESEIYVADMADRNLTRYPGGPAVNADEVHFATYKDTDLEWYRGMTESQAREDGYPLGLQIEQTTYGWSTGPLRDVVVIRYLLINTSDDSLYNCHAGLMLDVDIGRGTNDRASTVIIDQSKDSLNMTLYWSNQETEEGYGMMGVDILESPSVDQNGWMLEGQEDIEEERQLGLHSFRSGPNDVDPATPQERYKYISANVRDGDAGEWDIRSPTTTGPFNMRPGDTARVVFALVFAEWVEPHPVGSWDGLGNLLTLDRTVQEWWNDGLIVSAVDPLDPAGPLSPRIAGSYPNPVGATGSATILYDLPVAARAELRLYDPIGRLVERRDLGYGQGAGKRLAIDCAGLAAGVYTYEIRTGQGAARGSMTVLR